METGQTKIRRSKKNLVSCFSSLRNFDSAVSIITSHFTKSGKLLFYDKSTQIIVMDDYNLFELDPENELLYTSGHSIYGELAYDTANLQKLPTETE